MKGKFNLVCESKGGFAFGKPFRLDLMHTEQPVLN